ncbi:MAG: c-type cytochrome [Planctomycetaceae bacterium]|nr:c-type cytochrome [Planctomycetaceae bacterium]
MSGKVFAVASVIGLLSMAAFADENATPVERVKTLPGFEVELLYSVPAEAQGSWVAMTFDDKGRMIVSDQYGKLYRITVPAIGSDDPIQVEPLNIEIGMAHGLLYAFDSLYVMVNGSNKDDDGRPRTGLYRVVDSNGDGELDQVLQLRKLIGGGEHGPHAVILAPDGKSLYVCAGNHTPVTEFAESCVPRNWDEDILLDRQWDARGHARDVLAPGGWIARVSPDGEEWELISSGYRNEFDIAFSPEGELFTYDADMEWDIGTPWYRPTRVNHVTSGSEFGWRSGTGKWPEYYPDSLGSVVDIGPGSPTGIVFGTGARFPAKYQQALYIADWSYGTIYAIHLEPDGASYRGTAEEFLMAQPLPVTDMQVNPHDGALYFLIGGRKTQSGLYRVTYTGSESTAPAPSVPHTSDALRATRYMIEQMHGKQHPAIVEAAWPYLGHADRAIRFAARIAIEHQPVDTWAARVFAEQDPVALTHAAIALARNGNETHRAPLVAALDRIRWDDLSRSQQLDLLRAYGLVLIRLGTGDDAIRQSLLNKLDAKFPTGDRDQDRELVKLLIALEAPGIAGRALAQLARARTQEDQIHYAFALKDLETGWTPEERRAYFSWFREAAAHRGGMSFGGFLENIRKEALETLTAEEQEQLADVLKAAPAEPVDPFAALAPRPFVKKWTVDDLLSTADTGLSHRDFARGRELFATAVCFRCHRVQGEGGTIGPDLTGAGRRFNNRNLLESLIEPDKVVSDQYQKMTFLLKDGRVVEGRVINLFNDKLQVLTNMFDPSALEEIARGQIDESLPSTTSMMPGGLLDRFSDEEILDLLAFLKSGGDPQHEIYTSRTTSE